MFVAKCRCHYDVIDFVFGAKRRSHCDVIDFVFVAKRRSHYDVVDFVFVVSKKITSDTYVSAQSLRYGPMTHKTV